MKIEELTDSKQVQCPHCPKLFTHKFKLKTHLSVHLTEKPFSCQSCQATFKKNSALRRHIRDIHDQSKTFTCSTCNKTFNSKTNFIIHEKRHLAEFVVRCEHCNEGFVTMAEYRRHVDKHSNKEYSCEECGKVSGSERQLKEHKKIHQENYEDRYYRECPVCKRKFRHLKRHLKESHETSQNYVCPTCGKTFRRENSFKVHMKIHSGIRPYRCEVCRKEFYSKQYLSVHRRIHTGEKPYACQVCGKSFAQKPPLNVHMRTHSGEKPYGCDVCVEKFVSKQKLTFHKKSAHQVVC